MCRTSIPLSTAVARHAMDATAGLCCVAVMASLLLFFVPFLAFVRCHYGWAAKRQPKDGKNPPLPPSPPSLPVLGHLHLLRKPLHRTLAHLSRRHGAPVLLLRLGSRPAVVVSSPAVAEECFTVNDVVLANRPRLLASKHLGYDSTTLGSVPYGQLWRDLRRIAAVEMLSGHRLQVFSAVRAREVRSLVRQLFTANPGAASARSVELRPGLLGLAFNVVMGMMAGKRYYGEEVEDAEEARGFREIVAETFDLVNLSNMGDFLPWLRWVDFQGVERRMVALRNRRDAFLQRLVEELRMRRKSKGDGGGEDGRRTAVDVLLSLQEAEPHYYTDDIIKGFVASLVSNGSDTTVVTTEWALSLLLNNPGAMQTLRAELDAQMEPPGRIIDDHDLPRLPFLQAVVRETLRLYPSAPLLVPHESSSDCTVGGFRVPRGTMLVVNAWAIHRDPGLWEDPGEFKPERFLPGREGSGRPEESPYRFIPFGSGRRRCPAEGLALRVVALTLGALVQCFEWERVGEGEMDMAEGSRMSMPRAKALEVMYRPREAMAGAMAQLL